MRLRSISCAVFLFVVSAVPLRADEAIVSIGDRAYLTRDNATGGKIGYLRYPTLGCPALVVRGTEGGVWVKLPGKAIPTDVELSIRSTGDLCPLVFALPVKGGKMDPDLGILRVTYEVPGSAPEDTYDLKMVIPSLGISETQYNCLKVMRANRSDFNYVVLADPQFNDPRGIFGRRITVHSPQKLNSLSVLEQVKAELRALNPDFAILCGDLCFGLNYDYEYEGAWQVWKDTGVPIFMVPGNHDGYASTEERKVGGLPSPKGDGLDYWRQYIGPTFFSFNWGGVHFQGVNSYDGPAERRDGFLMVIENYGGDIGAEQLAWIRSDLARNRLPVVPFMHHNPLGPYMKNHEFAIWRSVARMLMYVFKGKTGESVQDKDDRLFDEFGKNRLVNGWIFAKGMVKGIFHPALVLKQVVNDKFQVWNTKETGEALRDLYDGRSKIAFIGHEHEDKITQYRGTTYKTMTCVATSTRAGGYWGYGFVKMSKGEVADALYQGTDFQSIPLGNLHVGYDALGYGTRSFEQVAIRSGLARSYDLTLEFTLCSADRYEAVGGEVVETYPLSSDAKRVWVRVKSPVSDSIQDPRSILLLLRPAAARPAQH